MYQKLDRPKHAKERLKSLNNLSNNCTNSLCMSLTTSGLIINVYQALK